MKVSYSTISYLNNVNIMETKTFRKHFKTFLKLLFIKVAKPGTFLIISSIYMYILSYKRKSKDLKVRGMCLSEVRLSVREGETNVDKIYCPQSQKLMIHAIKH